MVAPTYYLASGIFKGTHLLRLRLTEIVDIPSGLQGFLRMMKV
jgi:hypothetical protein